MAKEVPAFLRAEIGSNATDPTQETRNGTLGCLAEMRLEFAEGQFDWIEVGRILWEINQRGARRLDGVRNAGDLVHRQIYVLAQLVWLARKRDQTQNRDLSGGQSNKAAVGPSRCHGIS